jgi:hypothetical protein
VNPIGTGTLSVLASLKKFRDDERDVKGRDEELIDAAIAAAEKLSELWHEEQGLTMPRPL